MDESELKRQLSGIAALAFALPADRQAFPFIEGHLECLGSLDPELRDSLFYEAVDAWIAAGLLDAGELSCLTKRLVSSEFLYKGIGEQGGTDVFRRTFSALILDSIVGFTNASGSADPTMLETIALGIERYAREEQDLRGFVMPFGWAHSVAHAADVLASLMASQALPGWDMRILAATRDLLFRSRTVYTHQEDQRLARILAAHCRNHGDRRKELLGWVDTLLEACPPSFIDMEGYARRANLLDMLRAFYFYLHVTVEENEMASQIENRVRLLMNILVS